LGKDLLLRLGEGFGVYYGAQANFCPRTEEFLEQADEKQTYMKKEIFR